MGHIDSPWFGDTAEFVVHRAAEDEDDFPFELWQRMSPKDAVVCDVLASLDADGAAEVVEYCLGRLPDDGPRFAGYRVVFEGETLVEKRFGEEG